MIVLGADIRKAIELFEDEFEVRTGIQTPEGLISLDEDYSSDDLSEEARYGIEDYSGVVEKANQYNAEKGSRYSAKDFDLGASITLYLLVPIYQQILLNSSFSKMKECLCKKLQQFLTEVILLSSWCFC